MKKWAAFILYLSVQLTAFSQTGGETSLHILGYIEQFLAQAAVLRSAVDIAEQAQETLENAKMAQESAYNIKLLENEYLYRQAEVLSAENQAVREAFQRVFADVAAGKVLDYAQTTEEIIKAEYARADELSKKDYISLQGKNAAKMAYMQASSDTRTATDGFQAAQKALIRPIEQSKDGLDIEEFSLSVSFPEIPEVERIIDENATVKKLKADLALYVERKEYLGNSQVVSQAELDGIDDDIEQTEQLLKQQTWQLQDTVEQLQSQLKGNQQAASIAELNVEMKTMDLSAARHQYNKGDIHASDVTQAELYHKMGVDQLSSLERSYFMLTLDALRIMNVSLKQWTKEYLAE